MGLRPLEIRKLRSLLSHALPFKLTQELLAVIGPPRSFRTIHQSHACLLARAAPQSRDSSIKLLSWQASPGKFECHQTMSVILVRNRQV